MLLDPSTLQLYVNYEKYVQPIDGREGWPKY